MGSRVVQRQLFGTAEEAGVVGKLILQGLEILWLEWKGADQAGEVIDAVLTQSHDAFTDHAASLGGLACLIRGARQDGAVTIRCGPHGRSVRVRVAYCHHQKPPKASALMGAIKTCPDITRRACRSAVVIRMFGRLLCRLNPIMGYNAAVVARHPSVRGWYVRTPITPVIISRTGG